MIPTTQRVERNTPPEVTREIDERLRQSLSYYSNAGPNEIEMRLQELDREWNVERLIETEAPTMIGLGLALGILHDRRWFALPAIAASMVILHNLQGWYPLLPLFRRLGIRSQNEIEQERSALRVLRGDHETYQSRSVH